MTSKSIFPAAALSLLSALLLASCGSSSSSVAQRDYSDAVTNISQVDPQYRAYFARQNGANYTLSEQRRAYLAAVQTSRTPVRAMPTRSASGTTRLAQRSTKASAAKRAVASRKSASSSRGKLASAKKSSAKKSVSKKAVAKNTRKTATRKKASRRS